MNLSMYLNTFKNNWKKSTFGLCVLGYGINSIREYVEINNYMRSFCRELVAKTELQSQENVPRRVLVIVNPVSNNKKSEKMFKKYFEPMLHLGGFSVQIMKTNAVGHAKSLIEGLSTLPDAIVVAGGDGTCSEVVTGLLRRQSYNYPPIAVMPLGKKNSIAYKDVQYETDSKMSQLQHVSHSIISLIDDKSEYENVIKYDVLTDNSETSEMVAQKAPKPIFGLKQFSWGLFRDVEMTKDRFWYFGSLSFYIATILKLYNSENNNYNLSTKIKFSPPCAGCNNCLHIAREQKVPNSLFRKLIVPVNKNVVPDKKNFINDTCKLVSESEIETSQLYISCKRNDEEYYELETTALNKLTSRIEALKLMHNVKKNKIEPAITLKSRTIELHPQGTQSSCCFSIDGEEYDMRAIKLTLIPNAIKMFR